MEWKDWKKHFRKKDNRGSLEERRGENRKLLFNGYKVSAWDDRKVLETDSCVFKYVVNVLNTPELYT